jgi:hypothetical protein
MKQQQIVKRPASRPSAPIDRRTPSGRLLPY